MTGVSRISVSGMGTVWFWVGTLYLGSRTLRETHVRLREPKGGITGTCLLQTKSSPFNHESEHHSQHPYNFYNALRSHTCTSNKTKKSTMYPLLSAQVHYFGWLSGPGRNHTVFIRCRQISMFSWWRLCALQRPAVLKPRRCSLQRRTYVRVHARYVLCICVHMCACMCMHACMHACMYVWIYVRVQQLGCRPSANEIVGSAGRSLSGPDIFFEGEKLLPPPAAGEEHVIVSGPYPNRPSTHLEGSMSTQIDKSCFLVQNSTHSILCYFETFGIIWTGCLWLTPPDAVADANAITSMPRGKIGLPWRLIAYDQR